MSIHAIPSADLAEQHIRFLAKEFTYDQLMEQLIREDKMFPMDSSIWPKIIRRTPRGVPNRIEIHIYAIKRLSQTNKSSHVANSRPPGIIMFTRILEGELKDVARQAFGIIEAAKKAADEFAVLETI
jgi:hypothetical protein